MEVLSILEEPQFESKLPYIIVIIATLIALFAGYFKFKVSPLLGKKLPPGALGFPLIGESLSFLRAQKDDTTNEWIQSRIKKYGPVFKISVMGSKAVVLTGKAGNRFMFSGGDTGITNNQLYSVARILGKHNIFELSGHGHRLVRGAIMSFLKPESIQRYVGEMDSLIQQQLKQELNGKDCIKVKKLIKTITFKVTCSLLFGLPEGKEKDALFKDFKKALKGMWVLPLNFWGTAFRKALEARGRISAMLSDIIKRRKEELIEKHEGEVATCDHDDVISIFFNLRDESGNPLSEEEMIDHFITLVFASHDTTTVVLCYLIRHLARDADIFDKVLQEQKEIVKARQENGGKITWNHMQMMKYTWRVIQELMRLSPPVFGNFKSVSRDTNFGGLDIPKGWQVLWVTSGTQMDKDIFEEPEKFDPSRFESSSKSFPPYTYIPFGAGPRICPGAEFARIELLLIIHHLITNYAWTEMIPNEPITRKPMPYPAMGLPIKLYPRKSE